MNKEKLIDHRFGIASYEQYLIDLKEKKFSKICLTEVINADMNIATYGEESYFSTCSEIFQMGNMAYKQMGIDHLIHTYIHTYKSFIAVANDDMSDEDFYNLMKANHEQYELITDSQTGIGGVSRFVLAFGENLINRAKCAFYLNKGSQTNFILASNENEQIAEQTEKNQKIFDLLNYAILNNKVVPFYQGIYDNKEGKINKYEALMRIYDKEGKVVPPGLFLDVAKKFKLYLPLSKIIIDKCLTDFEDKKSKLGFNISLFDIQSTSFREWLLDRLKRHPTPNNVVIEFVETENYNKDNLLYEFLQDAREIGCEIAVDDFGVGYATYVSIMSLKPDVIKIDGEIISTLPTNHDNRMILRSIKYMADLVGAKTTAEFVENADVQKVVIENKIDFSQGYHFAKPQPIEELNII